MNLLVDALPSSVEIGGREYPINTDFRAALRVILAFEDNSLTNYEKQYILLANIYPDIPSDVAEAVDKATWFLNGGEETEESEGKPRTYSFQKDGKLIFAAFRQTHGIDLTTADLHWWTFLALFMDIGSDTAFSNLVSARYRFKTGRMKNPEERRAYLELGDLAEVPEVDTRTLEQMEAERRYDEAVAEGVRLRGGK